MDLISWNLMILNLVGACNGSPGQMAMMHVDGGKRSGSGTILRLAVIFSTILREELHIYNIRAKRSPPGLRPQHLEALLTAAKLSDAEVKGAGVGSREVWFKPRDIEGGAVQAEIGTAGSIPMLLLTILPICIFAKRTVTVNVRKGGTDVRNAPTINYLRFVLLPALERMGVKASISVEKYGYYPVGMGEVTLTVTPSGRPNPLVMEEPQPVNEVNGISVSTHLKERRVAERQAEAARRLLAANGYAASIESIYDTSNPLQKGSSIVLWTIDGAVMLGGDAIGELRKPSEAVGEEAAGNLLKELRSGATVDVHLADMLIPYMALAPGSSSYLVRSITEHIDTNIWLAEELMGAKFRIGKLGDLYRVMKE